MLAVASARSHLSSLFERRMVRASCLTAELVPPNLSIGRARGPMRGTSRLSTATTPGVQLPGAFPYKKPFGDEHDGIYAKETTANAAETAKGYAYNAGESARGYAYSAGKTEQIPPCKDGRLSTRICGVGTLPGPPGETGVAQLPEERVLESSFPSSGLNTSITTLPNGQNIFDAIDPAVRKNSLAHPELETEGLAKLPEDQERRQQVFEKEAP